MTTKNNAPTKTVGNWEATEHCKGLEEIAQKLREKIDAGRGSEPARVKLDSDDPAHPAHGEMDGTVLELYERIQGHLERPQPHFDEAAPDGAGKTEVLRNKKPPILADGTRDLPLSGLVERELRLRSPAAQANEAKLAELRAEAGSLQHVLEVAIEAKHPEIFRKLYPRVYNNVGRFHSPKLAALHLACVVTETQRYGYHKIPTAYRIMLPSFQYLVEHRVPMFFLEPQLLEAIRQTKFDDDIPWPEMPLPFESGCFILPKGALVHPADGEVSVIYWTRMRPGVYNPPFEEVPEIRIDNTGMAICALCADHAVWFESALDADVRPTLRLNNLFYRKPGEATPAIQQSNPRMDVPLDEGDEGFLEQVGVIAFGTFLAMAARPQLVERGKLQKRVGKGDRAREFWSPNVIGAKYKIKREVPRIVSGQFAFDQRARGTHASPRLHWRAGHFRQQPYGPGRKERKQIWLEPMLINAIEEESK